MRPKILIVLDNLGSGGAQFLFLNLAEYFIQKGYEVHLFVYSTGPDFFDSKAADIGVKLYRFEKKRRGFSISILLKLIRVINQEEHRHIISVMHNPSIYASLANLFFASSKLIVCEVSSSIASMSKIRRLSFLFCANFAKYVVVNSYSEANIIARKIWKKDKVKTIWNGYPLPNFPFKLTNRSKLRRIIVVARMHHAKNGMNLLKALDTFYLRNDYMPELIWVGREDTDAQSIQMQENMRQFLDNRPYLKQNVLFKGEVKDIIGVYHSADVLALVSLYEGLPNVICEAMMCGTLVLASDIADHARILGRSEERGFLASPDSPEEICYGLEKVSKLTVEERRNLLLNSRDFAIGNFNIQQSGKKFLNLLDLER